VVLSDVGDSNALRANTRPTEMPMLLSTAARKPMRASRPCTPVDAFFTSRMDAVSATMLTTGINDPRVAPWQPGKMAARFRRPMQRPADRATRRLRCRARMGSTRTQLDELLADQLAFMLWQMGEPDFRER